MMLAVVYFHTGYATVLLLVTNGLGTLFSVMGFLQVRRISAGDRFFCRCTQKQVLWLLGALELACAVALAIQISDGWLMCFLAVTAALAIYLPFVAVLTLVEALEEMLAQRGTRRRAEVAAAKVHEATDGAGTSEKEVFKALKHDKEGWEKSLVSLQAQMQTATANGDANKIEELKIIFTN